MQFFCLSLPIAASRGQHPQPRSHALLHPLGAKGEGLGLCPGSQTPPTQKGKLSRRWCGVQTGTREEPSLHIPALPQAQEPSILQQNGTLRLGDSLSGCHSVVAKAPFPSPQAREPKSILCADLPRADAVPGPAFWGQKGTKHGSLSPFSCLRAYSGPQEPWYIVEFPQLCKQ